MWLRTLPIRCFTPLTCVSAPHSRDAGLAGGLDVASSFLLLAGLPLRVLHACSSALCRAQLRGLAATWRMMRSRYRAGLLGRPATPFEQMARSLRHLRLRWQARHVSDGGGASCGDLDTNGRDGGGRVTGGSIGNDGGGGGGAAGSASVTDRLGSSGTGQKKNGPAAAEAAAGAAPLWGSPKQVGLQLCGRHGVTQAQYGGHGCCA
jgi:hypothetical protein